MGSTEQDNGCSVSKDKYTIKKVRPSYILKKIRIKKEPLVYCFIGGMWYSKKSFSFDQAISLPYPFSTYYTFKILDKLHDSDVYRSAVYVKMPICIIQTEHSCTAITFDPVINIGGSEIFPFIGLKETDSAYEICFVLFSSYDIKTKDQAWLGRGKKETVEIPLHKGDRFQFKTDVKTYDTWQDAVQHVISSLIPSSPSINNSDEIFTKAKSALWRSYDALTGSFLQLPWKHQPGFTFQNSSYSLLSYEAVRLDYFSAWNQTLNDPDLSMWEENIRQHFTNPDLSRKPYKKGEGLIWYNMTNLTKQGLQGYFYMDCGYAGYPGGQATICYHLLHYLKRTPDKSLKDRVHKTIEYLMTTQQSDGSWPMAIRHEGIIRFRPERLEKYTTSGGTGEAIRALLLASELYKNASYAKAATQGLSFLSTAYPICFHGLRDIGIHEPEAFSAVSIIHAFLDGYEFTGRTEYRDQAFTYAWYLIPWIYTYNTQQWRLSYTIHPISFSITPRVSPYETIWIVSLFHRLAKFSKDSIWSSLAKLCYHSVLPFISSTGGVSEGVFPIYQSSLTSLPMEQTFATAELMNASYVVMDNKKKSPVEKRNLQQVKHINMKQEGEILHIYDKDEIICSVDASRCQITYLKGADLKKHGISFSFNGSYSFFQQLKQKVKMSVRGRIGKFLLGVKDVRYVITGVKEPTIKKSTGIDMFSNHIQSHSIQILSHTKAMVTSTSQYHRVSITIQVYQENDAIVISLDPLKISVLNHDVSCTCVYAPYINASVSIRDEQTLQIGKCLLKGPFQSIEKNKDMTLVDQTLRTNWTHGGLFSTAIDIIIKK